MGNCICGITNIRQKKIMKYFASAL